MQIGLTKEVANIFDALKTVEPESDSFFVDFFISEYVNFVNAGKIHSAFAVIKTSKVNSYCANVVRELKASADQEEFFTGIHLELESRKAKGESTLVALTMATMVRDVLKYIKNNDCDCEFENICVFQSIIKGSSGKIASKKEVINISELRNAAEA